MRLKNRTVQRTKEERNESRHHFTAYVRIYFLIHVIWRGAYKRVHAIRASLLGDMHWDLNYKLSGIRGNEQESSSGVGSSLAQTTAIREAIPRLLSKYHVQSILDAPCCDANWIKEIDLNIQSYQELDISRLAVERNKKDLQLRRLAAITNFTQCDIRTDEFPTADLIICRDLLVHLSLKDCIKVLKRFVASNSKYLLITNFDKVGENSDIVTGSWRPLDLVLRPFFFPKPLETVTENDKHGCAIKQLCLYDLRKLKTIHDLSKGETDRLSCQ